MKKLIALLLSIFLLTAVFVGCSKPSQTTEGKFTDSQEYLIDPVENAHMCESPDSFYYACNSFIYVIDKDTHKAAVLCNKPDCLHENEYNPGSCHAYISSAEEELLYYDGSLYTQGQEERSDMDGNRHWYDQIFRVTIDGSNRELVYETSDMRIFSLRTHRGYIYFTAAKYIENEGASSDRVHLYRLPVSGGKPKQLKIKYFDKQRDVSKAYSEGYEVLRMHYFGDYLYIRVNGRIAGKTVDSIVRVNLKTLKTEDIGKSLSIEKYDFTVIGDKVYYVSNKKLYEANTNGTGEKVLKDLKSYGYKAGYTAYTSDGENIVINCYNSEIPGEDKTAHFLLFNAKTKKTTEYNLPADTRIGGTPECLLLLKEEGTDSKSELYYVDKTKLDTENYCKKIYDFPRE